MVNDNDNSKNLNEKQPGENPDGKYHFNPGNMAVTRRRMRSERPRTAVRRTPPKTNPLIRR